MSMWLRKVRNSTERWRRGRRRGSRAPAPGTRTFAVYLGKVGQGWPVQTGNFEDLKHAQDRRDAAERLRVLYVAMTRAKDVLMLPVFPTRPTGTMMADLAHVLPLTPDFRRRHRGWNLVDGSKIQRVTDDPAPVRLQIPAGPTDEGETIRVERETWLSARKAGLGSAGTPDRVVIPSGLVDQAKLKVLKRRAVRLESSRGGRPLGSLVHEVLATIPLDRADRAAEYVRYFANKRGMNEPAIGRAISLIQAALGSEVVRPAPGARSWREVPFAMETPDGIIEGSIDLVILADGVTVVDFKTDAADAGKEPELEAFYVPQLESYVQVMKRVGVDNVTSRLVFLRSAP